MEQNNTPQESNNNVTSGPSVGGIPPTTPNHPKSKKGLLLASLVVATLLAVGGAVLLLRSDSDDKKITPQNDVVEAFNMKTTLSGVLNPISNQYPGSSVKYNKGDTSSTLTMYDAASKRYVAPLSADEESADIQSTTQDSPVVSEKIVSGLKEKGFKEYSTASWPEYAPLDKATYLTNATHTCNVSSGESSDTVYTICIKTTDAKTTVTYTQPFYDAAIKEGDDPYTLIVVRNDSLKKNTKYTEYETISGGIGDASGTGGAGTYWYRKNSGTWQFGLAVQAEPSCDQFDTIDLQKAFYDMSCFATPTSVDTTDVSTYYKLQ